MKIVWAKRAFDDLVAIRQYIARDSETAAADVMARLVAAADSLVEMPNRGHHVIWRENVRQLVVGSYLVFYRVRGDAVGIGRVLHGSRDLRSVFRRFPRVP